MPASMAARSTAAGLLPLCSSAASTSARLSHRARASSLLRADAAAAPACSSVSSTASSSRSLITLTRSSPKSSPCRSCGHWSSNHAQGTKLIKGSRAFSSSSPASASAKDPYGVLGVKKDANVKDIKRAYYDLAKKFHPDTNKDKGAKERFVEIQNAYDLLSDEKKRAAYDQYGTTDGQPGFDPFGGGGSSPFGAGGFGGFQDFGGFANAGNAGSIFESLFGAFGGGRPGQRGGPGFGGAGFAGEARGEDLETTINLTFEEACKGTRRKVIINPIERCGSCSGSGLKAGAKKSTCGTCNGTGTRTFVIQSGFQMATTCPSCGGAGSTVAPEDNCKSCDGLGRVRGRKEVEIDLPAGVDDGFRIRKDGFGDVPLSGTGIPGSLYVRINVAPSKIWRRQGSMLFYPATIPFHTAILGGKVRVPTLDGPVEVRVPPGTQVGEEMILQGRGVPSPTRRGQKGDLMVQFEVTMPRSLSKRQREILQQYADEVEGRAPKPAASPSPSASTASAGATSGATKGKEASQNKPTTAAPDASSTSKSSSGPSSPQPEQQQESASASKATARSSKGRFTIHPSSRSEYTMASSGTSSATPSSSNKATSTGPVQPQARSSPEDSTSSEAASGKGILGKAWDWMTGKQ
ncbi:hypothetical protein BCV70DRAFT_198759 [Testicularia cyperi]|uniref:DnaJ homolog 1, mitochondrial n=1 Tax=Testicularia cyperi TaxID=1882483 RepID=A0A317XVJ9_9BASI|nr:hypothetical protein BCV70DRAFT_198759 [Testicularia cyperi]